LFFNVPDTWGVAPGWYRTRLQRFLPGATLFSQVLLGSIALLAKAVAPIKQNEEDNSKHRGVGERHGTLQMSAV